MRLRGFSPLESHGVLGLMLVQFLVAPSVLLWPSGLRAICLHTVFEVVLVSFVAAAAERRREFLVCLGLVVTGTATRLLAPPESLHLASAANLASVLALGLVLNLGLRRYFAMPAASAGAISGAVASYILAGVFFALLYGMIEAWSPGAFRGSSEGATAADLHYFSFVTLTTLGYGDIVPLTPWARALSLLEAIFGQVFLVVLLGRLVSLELRSTESELPS